MKVTVVGAGAVGASCAEYIAIKNFASEVVLLDIKEGYAEGKAMDLMQCASLNGFDTKITGTTNDYSKTDDSNICVITSGIPRKPGMTREELIGINAGIVKTVSENLVKFSPNTILIVVSNPMDTMTYLAHKVTGLPKNRIIGMGGALDSARFKYRLAEALNAPISDVDGMVIGGHSDVGMVPLISHATRNRLKLFEFGKTYHQTNGERKEINNLALFITGNIDSLNWKSSKVKTDFFFTKGIVNSILNKLGIIKYKETISKNNIFEYGQNLLIKEKSLVEYGLINSDIIKYFSIDQNIFYINFNWNLITDLIKDKNIKYKQIPKFPEVKRDFALLVDKSTQTPEEKLQRKAKDACAIL